MIPKHLHMVVLQLLILHLSCRQWHKLKLCCTKLHYNGSLDLWVAPQVGDGVNKGISCLPPASLLGPRSQISQIPDPNQATSLIRR